MSQFGYHMTLDFYGCEFEPLNSMDICHKVLSELPGILEMKVLCPPYILKANGNIDEGGKDPGGFTGFTVIAESHISIHTFAKRGFVSMDLYSCKIFDYDKALSYLKEIFKPKDVEIHKIDRGLKYPEENIY